MNEASQGAPFVRWIVKCPKWSLQLKQIKVHMYYVLWDKEVKVHGIFTNSGKFLTVHEFMTHSYDKNECVRVA